MIVGWICPKCGAAVSPHLQVCPCSQPWNQKASKDCGCKDKGKEQDDFSALHKRVVEQMYGVNPK